jgi:uncharacterized protein
MSPIYQVLRIPGQKNVSFNIMEAYVPVSQNDNIQTLAGFVFGNCDYGPNYGRLSVYETPAGESIDGPALIDSRILSNQSVSQKITLLDSGGSSVVLGNILMVPLDGSIIYFRPLYVQPARNNLPQLSEVIAVYNTKVYMYPTLDQTLSELFGTTVRTPSQSNTPPPTNTTAPISAEAQQLISQESSLIKTAVNDLKAGNFTGYASAFTQLESVIQKLQTLSAESKSSSTSGTKNSTNKSNSSGTTTTTAPTTTTTTTPGSGTTTSTTAAATSTPTSTSTTAPTSSSLSALAAPKG